MFVEYNHTQIAVARMLCVKLYSHMHSLGKNMNVTKLCDMIQDFDEQLKERMI